MPESAKTGVWLVGARGSVATTSMVGAAAVGSGVVAPVGMVAAVPPLSRLPLAEPGSLVFGGQDVVATPLVKRAEELAAEGVFPAHLVATVADRLAAADHDVVAVPALDDSSPGAALRRMIEDLTAFRSRHRLETVVVVNVASTEPPPTWSAAPADSGALAEAVAAGWGACPASVVAALGALEAGCSFVDFTPGAATAVPALQAMASERGLPLAGRDGKTGETLLKTALAPMFADRGLRVLSWTGTNLLGGGDGARLADPRYAAAKVSSKGRALEAILPDEPRTTSVHIDLVPDLGQWKTAWDHVHFEGFLGTRMTLQFTWQGCDSALAAPLVIDLARLAAAAQRRRIGGPLGALGFFFKDPVGSEEHRLGEQYAALCRWAEGL